MTISELMKFIRKNAGLSQAAFAKSLEISAATIAAYESGRIKPSQKVIEKIREIYGADVIADVAEKPAPKKRGRKPAVKSDIALETTGKSKKEKTSEKKKKETAPEKATGKPAELLKEEGKKRTERKPAIKQPMIYIQSIMGGTVSIEEIMARVKVVAPGAEEIYVKAEENKAYYVGEGVDGFVLLWE